MQDVAVEQAKVKSLEHLHNYTEEESEEDNI
jgi:hypothetical protein